MFELGSRWLSCRSPGKAHCWHSRATCLRNWLASEGLPYGSWPLDLRV